MDRPGHFGGSLLLYFALLCVVRPGAGPIEEAGFSLAAAALAASMSMKPDTDRKIFWGIFHRTWLTHSLLTVAVCTTAAFILFYFLLGQEIFSYYVALAVFSATLSHVLLDSLTKKGVPLLGPFDRKMRGLKVIKGSSTLVNYGLLAAGALAMLMYYGLVSLNI